MAVILPDKAKDVVGRMQTDVKAELPNSNPWLKNSYIKAQIQGFGNRIFDHGYFQLKNLMKQLTPYGSESVWLQFWADIKNILPNTALPADGPITITGTVGTSVPIDRVYTIGTIEYTLDAAVTIATNTKTVSVLTSSGGTATCLTDDDHGFATGKDVIIAGATQSDYNGTFSITVTGAKSFTYPISQGASSPASGTITASMDMATGQVTADLTTSDGGVETNQENGAEIVIQTSIAGIDDTAVVQWDGLTGGTDDETASEYKSRIVERWQNPLAEFNAARIKSEAKKIDGVTRVWVYQPGDGDVVAGEVKIYFTRDNDESIVPESGEVTDVKDQILTIKPANTLDSDVIVPGITGIAIDVTVANVSPNTVSMQNAIRATINSYYRGGISESEDHTVDKLSSAIQQTYDAEAGEKLVSFTLIKPISDTPVSQGEIAIEGTTIVNN